MGRYGVACPYDMAPVSRRRQPSVSGPWLNSYSSRDFPMPGSPLTATSCPCPPTCSCQGFAKGLQLDMAPDETGEPLGHCHSEPRPHRCGANQFEDLHRFCESFDGDGPHSVDLHQPLHQMEGSRRQQDAARSGELFHAGRQVHCLPHRRVIHGQVVADRRTTTSPELRPIRICTVRPWVRRTSSP